MNQSKFPECRIERRPVDKQHWRLDRHQQDMMLNHQDTFQQRRKRPQLIDTLMTHHETHQLDM